MSRKFESNARYQPISGAARITGLSQKYIREGCKAHTIPHIRVGRDYRIDMVLFQNQLMEESKGGCSLG